MAPCYEVIISNGDFCKGFSNGLKLSYQDKYTYYFAILAISSQLFLYIIACISHGKHRFRI
jgi:hypothetical protein